MTIEFSKNDVLGLEATVGLLQTISNAAGAYVELAAEGTVCSFSMGNGFELTV